MDENIILALVAVAIIGTLAVVISGVKIIQPYEQGIYMRLGKFVRILNQGLNFVCPLINQVVKLDLRTEVLDVPSQEVITKDNSPVNVDAIIYIKVIDPKNAFFEVTNYHAATINLAQTTLRSTIGEMELDEILSSREKINVQLRDTLDESTDKWGVKIEAVEIREVDPAKKVKDSMEEQTSAERRRRAAILQADGLKRAAILESEGKKKSMILQAEGQRQSMVLQAEGQRLATILESQGDAQKLRITAVGASSLDSKAMAVLSMDTLKSVGEGASSKFFFPIELTKLVDGISQYMGAGTDIPERAVSDKEAIETAVGKADDILGPIPTAEEIKEQIDDLDAMMDKDRKESETLVKTSSSSSSVENL
ncbi:MAG: SPFH domain-containing protein [Candidatus Methanomethylophilaceae archaeon]